MSNYSNKYRFYYKGNAIKKNVYILLMYDPEHKEECKWPLRQKK
jgi:hypothetical protein